MNVMNKGMETASSVFDLGFFLTPDLSKYGYVVHIVLISYLIPIFFHTHTLKTFLYYISIIFTLRLITISMTVLPKSNEKCNSEASIFGGCHDKIFSGHTSCFFLATLIYIDEGYITPIIGCILSLIYGITMIAVRGHYTIDVFLAYYITFTIKQFIKE